MAWPQQPFGVRFGKPAPSAVDMLVCSLYSDQFEVFCNKRTYRIVTHRVGTTDTPNDIDQAGYVGHLTIEGLRPNKTYTCVITHRGESKVRQSRTLPSDTDDFTLMFITCDHSGAGGQGHLGRATGMYGYIKNYHLNGKYPLAAIVGIDDMGYVSNASILDASGTGHSTSGGIAQDGAYRFALSYLNQFGLLQDMSSVAVHHSRSPDRLYCTENINWICQFGDWEFGNNIGENEANADLLLSNRYINGLEAWNEFYGSIAPDLINLSSSRAWSISIGGVQILAPDRVSNADFYAFGGSQWLGDNQIDDILNAASNDASPFKVVASSVGVRYLSAANDGTQDPLYEHFPAEWRRLITENVSHNGIQALSQANGFNWAWIQGDHHQAQVAKHERADVGVATESFISVIAGTVNGSVNQALSAAVNTGMSPYNGSTCLWRELDGSAITAGGHDYWCVQLDRINTSTPKRTKISLVRKNWEVITVGEWQDGQSGNLPAPVPKTIRY